MIAVPMSALRQTCCRLAGVVLALAVAPGVAAADPFGGFSRDKKTYLAGRSDVCQPLAVAGGKAEGVARCTKTSPRDVSAAGFRRARSGGLRASHAGRTLTVTGADGAPLVTWEAPVPISRVVGVYASDAGGLVAVDYVARRLGRSGVDVVGFALPGAAAVAPAPTEVAPTPTGETGKPEGTATAARDRAETLLRRRKWSAAADAFRAALEARPNDLRARYGLAKALARQKKRAADAVAELARIAGSGEPSAVEWVVNARMDPAFKRLRKRADFRKAVARRPGAPVSAYERLVADGTLWQQPVDPCNAAGVKVRLYPLAGEFDMRIDIRCGPSRDGIALGGTWSARGADELVLVFPNDDDADETVVCKLSTCEGGADCIACALEDGLSFELRRLAP